MSYSDIKEQTEHFIISMADNGYMSESLLRLVMERFSESQSFASHFDLTMSKVANKIMPIGHFTVESNSFFYRHNSKEILGWFEKTYKEQVGDHTSIYNWLATMNQMTHAKLSAKDLEFHMSGLNLADPRYTIYSEAISYIVCLYVYELMVKYNKEQYGRPYTLVLNKYFRDTYYLQLLHEEHIKKECHVKAIKNKFKWVDFG